MNFEFPKIVFKFFSFSSFIIQDVPPWPPEAILERTIVGPFDG
jgi:hypothetical protein